MQNEPVSYFKSFDILFKILTDSPTLYPAFINSIKNIFSILLPSLIILLPITTAG